MAKAKDIQAQARRRMRRMGKKPKVFFTIDERLDGLIQLAINDENGGYRICGPKYDGTGRTIKRHELTVRDAERLMEYISK